MRSRPASTTRAFHLRSRLPAHSIAGSRRSSILPSPPVWRPHEPGYDFSSARAGVAHLVERDLAKVEVAGSKPVSRSNSPFASLRLVRGRPLLVCRAPLAPVALQLAFRFAQARSRETSVDLSGAAGARCAPTFQLGTHGSPPLRCTPTRGNDSRLRAVGAA